MDQCQGLLQQDVTAPTAREKEKATSLTSDGGKGRASKHFKISSVVIAWLHIHFPLGLFSPQTVDSFCFLVYVLSQPQTECGSGMNLPGEYEMQPHRGRFAGQTLNFTKSDADQTYCLTQSQFSWSNCNQHRQVGYWLNWSIDINNSRWDIEVLQSTMAGGILKYCNQQCQVGCWSTVVNNVRWDIEVLQSTMAGGILKYCNQQCQVGCWSTVVNNVRWDVEVLQSTMAGGILKYCNQQCQVGCWGIAINILRWDIEVL